MGRKIVKEKTASSHPTPPYYIPLSLTRRSPSYLRRNVRFVDLIIITKTTPLWTQTPCNAFRCLCRIFLVYLCFSIQSWITFATQANLHIKKKEPGFKLHPICIWTVCGYINRFVMGLIKSTTDRRKKTEVIQKVIEFYNLKTYRKIPLSG